MKVYMSSIIVFGTMLTFAWFPILCILVIICILSIYYIAKAENKTKETYNFIKQTDIPDADIIIDKSGTSIKIYNQTCYLPSGIGSKKRLRRAERTVFNAEVKDAKLIGYVHIKGVILPCHECVFNPKEHMWYSTEDR